MLEPSIIKAIQDELLAQLVTYPLPMRTLQDGFRNIEQHLQEAKAAYARGTSTADREVLYQILALVVTGVQCLRLNGVVTRKMRDMDTKVSLQESPSLGMVDQEPHP